MSKRKHILGKYSEKKNSERNFSLLLWSMQQIMRGMLTLVRFHQHVYGQLLRTQIPKALKTVRSSLFFGISAQKAAGKMLVKLTPS